MNVLYYEIKDKLKITTVPKVISDNNYNTLNDYINHTYNNEEYIEGFECEICKNKSIYKIMHN